LGAVQGKVMAGLYSDVAARAQLRDAGETLTLVSLPLAEAAAHTESQATAGTRIDAARTFTLPGGQHAKPLSFRTAGLLHRQRFIRSVDVDVAPPLRGSRTRLYSDHVFKEQRN
jgi:hypothetical protein